MHLAMIEYSKVFLSFDEEESRMLGVIGAIIKTVVTAIFFGVMGFAGILIGKKLRENKDRSEE